MILNERYLLKPEELATFRFPPTRSPMMPGMHLYRFVTLGDNYILGAFWLDKPSFERMERFSRNHHQLLEIARSWSSIKYEWNKKMHHLCEIRLLKPCYAWVGPSKFQSIRGDSNVLLMGNAYQVFLPNLDHAHASISRLTQLV